MISDSNVDEIEMQYEADINELRLLIAKLEARIIDLEACRKKDRDAMLSEIHLVHNSVSK